MENIFVPSKNRIGNSAFLKYAKENSLLINVVVEPNEHEKYKEAFPSFNYIVLPKNDMGITYVRNFIKSYTEQIGLADFWQLDDDLTGLFYREGTKLVRAGIEVLELAKKQFTENGVALGALEYRQFAWSASKDMVENSFCDSCVYFNNNMTNELRYREYLEGKEDRDFAMQVIKSGNKTGRTTLYAFSSPPNGSNAGGLKEIFYDLGKEEVCSERMIETWGRDICVPITKDNGRKDVKIRWDKINSKQTTLF
jgi:hypothetical protein